MKDCEASADPHSFSVRSFQSASLNVLPFNTCHHVCGSEDEAGAPSWTVAGSKTTTTTVNSPLRARAGGKLTER